MKRILITVIVGLVLGLVLGSMLGRKWPPTEEQVVEYISHMSFPEMASFNKKMAQSGLQVYQTQMLPPTPAVPAPPTAPTVPGK